MVQIIAGKMGKGKTKFLLEKANVAVKECNADLSLHKSTCRIRIPGFLV